MPNDATEPAGSASIAPWITVSDANAAVDFYLKALGAQQQEVLKDDDSGEIMVAQLTVGGADFWLQSEPDAPTADGGKPIRMILSVDDPDALFTQAIDAGAKEISPVSEDHGWRVGRIADPFGNQWEIGKRVGGH
jgi:PhnB protein